MQLSFCIINPMPVKYLIIAISKILLFLLLLNGILISFIWGYFEVTKGRPPRVLDISPVYVSRDLVILPYVNKNYAGYGDVLEPEIDIRVKSTDADSIKITFLLDSGAVVSTLPIDFAKSLNIDITNASRIVLRGFGDKRTFGYMSDLQIYIKDEIYSIPVVFSEGELSKKILGRKGFFDYFTVVFDHKDKVIRLAK